MRILKSFFAIAIFVMTSSIFAQTDSLNYTNQFQAHFVNGFAFSYLTHISPASAIRLKADIGINYSDGSGDGTNYNEYSGSRDTYNTTNESSSNSQNYNLSVQFLWVKNIAPRLALFSGAGPFLGYSLNHSSSKTNSEYSNPGLNKSENSNDNSSTNAGIIAVLGLQCELTKNILLIAEYNFSVFYSWENSNSENYSESTGYFSRHSWESSTDAWNLSLSNIKLGVGFRF